MTMEHGMVRTEFPMFGAAMLYILFGLAVVGIVVWLHQRNHHEEH